MLILQKHFNGSNTDGSFTTAVWNSFLGPLEKSHSCRFGKVWADFLFYIENGILCVLTRIASMRRFKWEHTIYLYVEENGFDVPIMPSDLALWLTLISSNYPCLEHLFMVPKVFKPLKFDCTWFVWRKIKILRLLPITPQNHMLWCFIRFSLLVEFW